MCYSIPTSGGAFMVDVKEEFKDRLKKAMDRSGMKAIDLVKRTGISEATISQYRSGYSKPKKDRLELLANVLNVNPAWLMGLDVSMEPASSSSSSDCLSPDELLLIELFRSGEYKKIVNIMIEKM